ncbi:MAG: CHASE2 domain-containing protein [Microcoleus sp. PH2017_10_PVI_O_A]|uniref:CHASE2 domain-containing protein n=1 Tax=unclassified Microcoleus TaxID=2642155 RepID=UPI001DEAC753|nr:MULTISPECIES: CHASE2 domain-containing protein [unclassified Microcoleus]TAE80162.1 MAG: CHASE2 domain-containing protein [Oscillatoriales cyanobacterium]MCC3404588.1 CHASE2 domain-containing protein [Microcoleus sp. PH2017_10_PVI_O_A]MCC3461915.1 CHASE2 domain-containing protein [Microcoleus sp. PH2017_11_PCY_U_A]MCC3480301.1 CHASE2 domain-containing protein [Microcoleus sp. PH2017_12_PCY_D_A]MCC3527046.1 CHASE2 domain-containing protein [Microcoleus sp. PH2017_21_RUC_O_A]
MLLGRGENPQNMLKTLKKWLDRERRVLITASAVGATVIVLRWFGFLQALEWAAFDRFVRWRPAEPMDSRIVIIEINETDLQKYGYPISDAVLAQLLQKLHAGKPRAIGLDVYRDLPTQPGNAELIKTFKTIPNLIGIELMPDETRFGVRPPPVLEKLSRIGFNNVVLDADSKVRRTLLYAWPGNGKTYQSFALRLALLYLETEGISPQPATVNPKYLQLGKGVFQRFKPNDGAYVRSDSRGYQILTNLRHPRGSFRTVSMSDVLSGKVPVDFVQERAVLIGSTAPSLKDFHQNAYSSGLFAPPQPVPGVELQANFLSQILSAALDGREGIKVWPEAAEWLWILLWSWTGANVSWKLRSLGRSAWCLSSICVGLSASLYIAWLAGWWLPLIPSILSLLGSGCAVVAYLAHIQEELKRSKEFLQWLIDTIPDPIFVKDRNHRWVVLNQSYCRFIGYPLEILICRTDYELFPQAEADIFWQQDELVLQTQQPLENEEYFTDAHGITHLISTKRSLHKDAAGNLFLVGAIRDMTERKRLEDALKQKNAELSHQAYHDALTGLPNRKMFHESLHLSLERASSNQELVALLFLDLDGFKSINDTLGHHAGDLLLQAVAGRLKKCLRGSDIISRLGGDEFTVILPGIPGSEEAAKVAQKICDAIMQPFILEEHTVSVTTSIGISLYPIDGQESDILVKNADAAMYRAKEGGKNQCQFS